MRIIFMGSPGFAVPTLDAIVAAGHEVVGVYTQPPRAAGRGKAARKTALHERAEALGLAVRHPPSLRGPEEQAEFAALAADVAVVAAYGLILPEPILAAPRLGCINVHGSLLPRWRGAAPVQRAIEAGDTVSGVTIMQMEKGLDTGPMLICREVTIGRKNSAQLMQEIAEVGAAAMIEWLADPARTPPRLQPAEGITYAAKIDKAEAHIDWSRDADLIDRQVRAFSPSPGAWFAVGDERIKLIEAEVAEGSGSPGTVLDTHPAIACGTGALRLLTVQRAGRGALSADAWLRGFALPAGTILA